MNNAKRWVRSPSSPGPGSPTRSYLAQNGWTRLQAMSRPKGSCNDSTKGRKRGTERHIDVNKLNFTLIIPLSSSTSLFFLLSELHRSLLPYLSLTETTRDPTMPWASNSEHREAMMGWLIGELVAADFYSTVVEGLVKFRKYEFLNQYHTVVFCASESISRFIL